MSNLRKLILVDSFAASRIRELRLDGHVHVSGRNGRGKTTLIRLIPLFYGEQPSRIVRAAGSVVRTLKDFMFSRSTSYVAFEYENADGVKLAVLHYSGDTPQYHLADGPYAKEIFVADENLVEGRHLNARLRTLGRNPTSALGVLQYRAIVQGTAARQGMSELRAHMQRFALVPGRSRLAGIERISSGMFSKDITFAALKRMAASVAFDEEDKQIVLALSRKEIESFVPDFKAYGAVMDLEPAYLAANAAHLDSRSERERMLHAASRLKCLVLALGRLHAAARAGASEAQRVLGELQNEAQRTRSRFELDLQSVRERIDRLRAEIARIDAEAAAWQSKRIDELIGMVERLPELAAEVRRLLGRQQAMLSKAESVGKKFQALFAEEKARRTQMRADAQIRSNETIGQISMEREALRERREIERTRMAELQAIEGSAAREAWMEALEEVNQCDQARAALTPDPALVAVVESAQGDVQGTAAALERAVATQSDTRVTLTRAEGALRLLEQERGSVASKQAQARMRLEHLQSLESAGTGTLLHHLRRHMPSWHEDIAKVIREDLLLRTDLSPGAADGESLYGLTLELKRVEAGRAANEAALALDIEAARKAEAEATEALAVADRAIRSERTRLASCREQLGLCTATRAQAEDAAGQARIALEAARKRCDAELAQRRDQLQAARGEADAQAKVRKRAMDALHSAQQAARGRMETEFNGTIAATVKKQEAETRRLEHELSDLKRDEEAARKGLDGVRMAEMANAGVDTQALAILESELARAAEQLEYARNGAPTVESYRRWMAEAPERRAECGRSIESSTADAGRIERERAEAESGIAARIATQTSLIERRIAELENARERLEQAESAQQSRLAGVETDPASSADEVVLTWLLPEILTAFDDARKRWQGQEELLRKHLGAAVRGFRKPEFAATKIGEYAAHFADDPLQDVPATLNLLAAWYGTAHAQQRDVLAGKIRNGCGILRRFQDGMLDFQSSITGLSRELHENLASDMVFDAIKSLSLRLSALVERRPYWDALKRVMVEHDKWQSDGYAGLPGRALLDELQDFARHVPDNSLAENPESLMDLEIEVDDGTERKRVRTEADLRQVSSNGLSYLVLCLIFVAFANRARRNNDLWLTWALDEIGTIDEGNSRALLQMLDRNRIRLVSASPDARESLQVLFNHRYEVLPEFEIRRILNEDELPEAPREVAGATAFNPEPDSHEVGEAVE